MPSSQRKFAPILTDLSVDCFKSAEQLKYRDNLFISCHVSDALALLKSIVWTTRRLLLCQCVGVHEKDILTCSLDSSYIIPPAVRSADQHDIWVGLARLLLSRNLSLAWIAGSGCQAEFLGRLFASCLAGDCTNIRPHLATMTRQFSVIIICSHTTTFKLHFKAQQFPFSIDNII